MSVLLSRFARDKKCTVGLASLVLEQKNIRLAPGVYFSTAQMCALIFCLQVYLTRVLLQRFLPLQISGCNLLP